MIIRKIDHVQLICKNLDETLKAFHKILGMTPWSFGINESSLGRQTMLTPPDGARIELIQPAQPGDRLRKKLQEHGDGVYGISVLIEDFDKEIRQLKEKGVAVEEEVISIFPDRPFRIAWVPPSEGQGVWLELVDAEALPEFEQKWEAVS
jgi:catechol 2,3-dioxygenase-like lactoylglutathione lyase family enzyme